MSSLSLSQVIDKLERSPRVRGIFLTGSTATSITDSSDIDLIVILDTNTVGLKSIYTTIEDHFADIFFFDTSFLKRLNTKNTFTANDFDGMFVTWLTLAKIVYDPDALLKKLCVKLEHQSPEFTFAKQEQQDLWVKVNYNYIANTRYYKSNNTLYHQTLELRLLYSITELVTAYFSFRNIPWRGEKAAIEYLEQHDPEYLKHFQAYSFSTNLEQKVKSYKGLFSQTLHGEFKQWDKDFVIPMSSQHHYDPKLIGFWESLSETKKGV